MKKGIILAASLFTLCACGQNKSSLVNGLSDFLTYGTFAETTISNLAVKAEGKSIGVNSHSASFYLNDDFKYKAGSDDITGYTNKEGQHWRIAGTAAYLCLNTTALDQARAKAKTLVKEDYEKICTSYEESKSIAGKTASEWKTNCTYLYFAYSINGDVAGYTLKYTLTEGDGGYRTYLQNWTLDFVNSKWVFSYFVNRQTHVYPDPSHPGTTLTEYDIAEYTFGHSSSLEPLSISLDTCTSISIDGFSTKDIVYEDGIPLTKKNK